MAVGGVVDGRLSRHSRGKREEGEETSPRVSTRFSLCVCVCVCVEIDGDGTAEPIFSSREITFSDANADHEKDLATITPS